MFKKPSIVEKQQHTREIANIQVMSNTSQHVLASYIERARKVLQHEQRTHHQDQAIKPGGLEIFVGRWADEMGNMCKSAGLDLSPVHQFSACLEGYHGSDPMQRAASLRAALAILNELDTRGNSQARRAPADPPPTRPCQPMEPQPRRRKLPPRILQ